jgi:hypothetical protein
LSPSIDPCIANEPLGAMATALSGHVCIRFPHAHTKPWAWHTSRHGSFAMRSSLEQVLDVGRAIENRGTLAVVSRAASRGPWNCEIVVVMF